MSSDKNRVKRLRTNLSLKQFLSVLKENQKKSISSLISSSAVLRKTVYLSSGGKFLKYADFLRVFAIKSGYVPVHPVETLNYYLSSTCHNHNKAEVMKDCFSLMMKCDELWVFEEQLPLFEKAATSGIRPISQFPEGVLAEICFWLTNKPNSPIRFFDWKDVGVAKYISEASWSIIPDKKELEETKTQLNDYPKRFGIIDLGSSTVKLTICNIDDSKKTEVLHKKAITVNLAEGFFENNELQPAAMARTLEAIADCQSEALGYGVLDIKMIGTGVLRKAVNLDSFTVRVKEKTGLELKVLSSKDEAELVNNAVVNSFKNGSLDLIVVNAGGGSAGIIFNKDKKAEYYSIPLGISDLNEKFVGEYPMTPAKYEQMRNYIRKMLKDNIKSLGKRRILVYTGGELDYMIVTGFPLEDFGLSLSHPKKISLEKFKSYAAKMRLMKQEELYAFMPANPKWMNGAIASNTILETIAEFLGVETIIPSNKNLNDGVLLTMVE